MSPEIFFTYRDEMEGMDSEEVATVEYRLSGDSAIYLGTIMEKFEYFLRAIGFDYVRMYRDGESWVFDKNYHEGFGVPEAKCERVILTDTVEFAKSSFGANFFIGEEVQCVRSSHSDSGKVLGLVGRVIGINNQSPTGQTVLVQWNTEDGGSIDWWVSPEVIEHT